MDEKKMTPADVNETREIAKRLDALPPDVRADVQKLLLGAITAVETMGRAQQPQQGGAA
ncbi:MAG: hypothetical protein RR998_08485 [Oscillospiraceae bacterium]